MDCFNPVYLANIGEVPCGKCRACRKAKTSEWVRRLSYEAIYWEKKGFLTLTYQDDNLPGDLSIEKRELQLFFKRLRKLISCSYKGHFIGQKIKYFACGEYGSKYGRPHYHAILFGLDNSDLAIIELAWKKGFVFIGEVNEKTIRYVCKYVRKKFSGVLATSVYGDKEPPFQLQSQGLGLSWLNDHEEEIIEHCGIKARGKIVPMPRYFKKKLDGKLDIDILNARSIEKSAERQAREADLGLSDVVSVAEYRRLQRKAAEEALKTRDQMADRGKL